MAPIRRLVVDVLKPHDPPLARFTEEVADADTVEAATATLIELDQEVQNIQITIEGENLSQESIESTVEHLGGTVHSVDQVACGSHTVEDGTPLRR